MIAVLLRICICWQNPMNANSFLLPTRDTTFSVFSFLSSPSLSFQSSFLCLIPFPIFRLFVGEKYLLFPFSNFLWSGLQRSLTMTTINLSICPIRNSGQRGLHPASDLLQYKWDEIFTNNNQGKRPNFLLRHFPERHCTELLEFIRKQGYDWSPGMMAVPFFRKMSIQWVAPWTVYWLWKTVKSFWIKASI